MKNTNTSVDYIALNIQDWIMDPCTSIFGDCMSEGNRMMATAIAEDIVGNSFTREWLEDSHENQWCDRLGRLVTLTVTRWMAQGRTPISGEMMRAHDIDFADLWQACDEIVEMTWTALQGLERDS